METDAYEQGQDCDSVEQQLSVQDPGAHAQPKQKRTRHHRSLRCHEQGVIQQRDGLGGEINKHVSEGVNKLPVENKCDLTPQKTLPTDEAKELADSPTPKHE